MPQARANAPDFAAWREAVTAREYATVARRAKVPRDVREKLWVSYREHVGFEGVQMSSPRLVATNEYGHVYDLPFKTADGARHNFGVFLAEDVARPVYWTAESAAGKTIEELAAEVFACGGNTDNAVTRISEPLDAARSVISQAITQTAVPSPFDAFRLFVSDDMPMADWHHPARYLLIREDALAFSVVFADEPLSVSVDGAEVRFEPFGAEKTGGVALTARSGARLLSASAGDFPADSEGDASNCHALLISGGCRVNINHCRYWNEVCFVYNVLRKRFCLPRENIKVLWASGNPEKDLCRNGSCDCFLYAFDTNDLSDFDRDGNNDITGAATLANVRSVLTSYANKLKSTDQLLIFCSDHGSTYGGGVGNRAVVSLWGESLSDGELADLTKGIKCPVMAALKTCYSGGMIEEFCEAAPNRVMATADGYDPSAAHTLMGDWTYYFFSALCGYYPAGAGPLPTNYSMGLHPRECGDRCNADADGDGRVSFREAHLFAYQMNPWTAANGKKGDFIDSPQYGESTANLGKKMFLTQYPDAPAVVVKEKVLAPTLNPPSGSLGFAPCAVTVSCGTPGATIRYTTDGSEPTGKSTVYSGGIQVKDDTTVTVRAFKSGMEASDSARGAYTVRKTAPEKALITSVSQGDSSSGIVVCWSGGAGVESYDLLRSESPAMTGAATVASNLAASTSSWADLGAAPGRTYFYQIRSSNAYGSTLSAPSQDAYLMLNPPTRVSAEVVEIGLSQVTVSLSWQPAVGASSYRVYRQGPGGGLVAASAWQASCSFTDTAEISEGTASLVYYVQSASDAAGTHPSAYGEPVPVEARLSEEDVSLECDDWIVVKPGGTGSCSVRLRYSNGTYEQEGFISGVTCSLVGGDGVSVAVVDGSYDWQDRLHIKPRLYIPPSVSATASSWAPGQRCRAVVQYTFGNVTLAKEIGVAVYDGEIVRSIDLSSMPYVVPGFTEQMSAKCKYYSGATPQEGDVEVKWAIVAGGGATIDEDGELTAWNIDYRTNVVVQASVETFLGVVTATRKVNVSPSVIEERSVELDPLGGSYTNYFGAFYETTWGEGLDGNWLSEICWLSSDSPDPADINGLISIGHGRNTISIIGGYLFLSFRADRNPGKDREMTYKLRWDGGGIDFRIVQKEAPYARSPELQGGANGVISAASATDGSVLHYATDGEEPSADSPVMANSLSFEEDTEFAAKAFGEWMQASDTVYADVVGRGSQWDEVTVAFSLGLPGLAAPTSRTYKVRETFGELPSFPKTNGQYFKGWSLHEVSDKLVASTDPVPSQSATLHAVWSPVAADRPQWTALPWNFNSAMTATMKVYDDATGTYLDPSQCVVGIEDGDGVCRGSSASGFGDTQSELNGKNGLYVFGIYSQVESGEEPGLRIRVWNDRKGFMYVVGPELAFTAESALGDEASPYVIHVKPYACELSLERKGWHLVSFSALTEDASPGSVFADVADKIDQVVQGSKVWKPGSGGRLAEIEIGVGYWVRTKADNASWVVAGVANPGVEIALSKGWNLVGYPLPESASPATALKTAYDAGKITQIVDGSKVYPGRLDTLEPGKGYWVYAPAACEISFDAK